MTLSYSEMLVKDTHFLPKQHPSFMQQGGKRSANNKQSTPSSFASPTD